MMGISLGKYDQILVSWQNFPQQNFYQTNIFTWQISINQNFQGEVEKFP